MPVLCVGEVLWDVFPDAERLGGAPLNFAVALRRLGEAAAVWTAVGADARGERALAQMRGLGMGTEWVRVAPELATGAAVVAKDAAGNATFVIQRPVAYDALAADPARLAEVCRRAWSWLYFGTLAQTQPDNERLLRELMARVPGVRGFYDMNLREGHWNLALVRRLSELAAVVKLNESEAELLHGLTGGAGAFALEGFCRHWAKLSGAEAVCVTLGERGCAVLAHGEFHTAAGYPSAAVDTVGAGDAFAAGLLYGLRRRWPLARTAAWANALGALVAGRPGAIPDWSVAEAEALLAR